MKTFLLQRKSAFLLLFVLFLICGILTPTLSRADIYQPEGLNMPGSWNSWINPPSNLAIANNSQVSGGRLTKITSGTSRWQTIFSVAATGGDFTAGTYSWLFTSGPSANAFANKWANVNVTMNTVQTYVKEGSTNNSITLVNGKWYTMNWKDNGYANTEGIFMETSAQPVTLSSLSVPSGILQGQTATITLTTAASPSTEEKFYLRYSIDNWATSSVVTFSMSGSSGTAVIPAQASGITVQYYAFSSTVAGISSNYDMYTLKFNNNSGTNFSYTVAGLSNLANILTFSFPQQTTSATINSTSGTVSIEVAYGTVLTSLTPTITVSPGATINPLSGVAQNFSSPFNYIVTAQNGTTTKTWTITVTTAAPPAAQYGLRDDAGVNLPTLTYWYTGQLTDITEKGSQFNNKNLGSLNALYLKGSTIKSWKTTGGDVSGAQFKYKVWAVGGTEPATYTERAVAWTSDDGSGNQTWSAFGAEIGITNGLTSGNYNLKILFSITGTGVAGTTTDGAYTATFTYEQFSSLAEIVSFSLPQQASPATITSAAGTVNMQVVYGTSLTNLAPAIAVSPGATMTPASGVARDFTTPKTYLVTAENGTTTKTWTATITVASTAISWANLQFPGTANIALGQNFDVYGQVLVSGVSGQPTQVPGLQAWVGYSTTNTDPSTWTNWISAGYKGAAGPNDEFKANIGTSLPSNGTYYYATRYKLNGGSYVYGGYSATGGGFWNGTTYINGTVTVTSPSITWVNLQWPGSQSIEPSQLFNVYGRAWIQGYSGGSTQFPTLQAWIGYSTTNTDPSTWTNWISAGYNGASGNNDEFLANLGAVMNTNGTYYYATRFKVYNQAYVYGGFSDSGGGFWNGTTNINGVLTVGINIDCNAYNGAAYCTPPMPHDNDSVTLYFDATKGNAALLNYAGDVYAHTAVLTNLSSGPSDWRYVKSNWGVNTPDTKLTRISQNLYKLTINTPRSYYNVPAGETIQKMVFVFRSDLPQAGGSYLEQRNSDGSDISIRVYDNSVKVRFNNPLSKQVILNPATTIPVCVSAIGNTSISLYANNTLLKQQSSASLSYMLLMTQLQSGQNWLKAVASNGSIQSRDSIEIYLRGPVVIADLPSGAKNGINYVNDSTVTLVLHDPTGFKQYVYVIGEYGNWQLSNNNYMNRTPDGKRYWLTLTHLQPGHEYAYQYLVDGDLKLADPYAEKVLDPWNDQWISPSIYPNLKPYPTGLTDGVVSVLQTARPQYNWQVTNFTPAALNNSQSDMVVYELLLRDFTAEHTLAAAKQKLDYLKELGVNTVELMPVAEFDGNDSWGYSTNFFFAADKAYGTREDLKAFVDAAHQRGISVVLDMVVNHAFGLNPMVKMYWNSTTNQPSADNPWFNQQSPHPYSVGYDFNHESGHTRQFFKDVFQYWLTEYKVDGFRLDLSKGLTQTYSGNDLGIWNSYDQSRINILNDYKAHIKWVNPNAYVILEHFANNDEETVLANSGFLLWSAMHNNYKQVAMGWQTNSNVSWAYHGNRGWSYPNLVDYMETHDEERMLYEALNNGNSSNPAYDIKYFANGLHHQEQGIVLFMGIPGPKMLYEFQEMGYDYSKFYGGSNVAAKPPRWDYLDVPGREKLNRVVSAMAALRKTDAFRYGNFSSDLALDGKKIWITHSSMDVIITVNMGVGGFIMAPGFTHAGTWYDYFTGQPFTVTDPGGHYFYYNPGDYRVFTSQPMPKPFFDLNVTVVDGQASNPMQDVNVRLSNSGSRITGANGLASFTALPKRDYITAQKFGWHTQTVDTLIGANTNLTITLQQGWDPAMGWVNLQAPGTGSIQPGNDFNVYAQVWIDGVTTQATADTSVHAWIGYSTTNSDPSTWTNWVPATYHAAAGNNDEYSANIGSLIMTEGTYYYASRFRKGSSPYAYGGFAGGVGGFWNGTTNVSGVLGVHNIPQPIIGWANLQHPGTGSITPGQDYNVYAQAWIENITGQATATPGLQAWIGYSTTNTNPATWTNWVPATYSSAVGNNDEFTANLGTLSLPAGTYYYASRFKYNTGNYVYGGYSATTGGFWDGASNTNGVLTISNSAQSVINWANLQWPGDGTIAGGGDFSVYGQVYVAGFTGQPAQLAGLQAWVGYSTLNSDPSTWTTWVPASYNVAVGNNDEFQLNLGPLITSAGTYYYAFRYRLNSGSYYYGGYSAGGGGFWNGTSYSAGVLTVTSSLFKTLHLKLYLEGLYNSGTGAMMEALGTSGPQFGSGVADKVNIELHNAVSPYATEYTLNNCTLMTDGTLSVTNVPAGITGSYYLVVKHRNSLETWSNSAVSFGSSPVTYDFSTSASKAYGNNLKSLGPIFAIYGGDATQDGVVDGSDMAAIDNASTAILTGYFVEDVNGDGVVDGSDMALIDNNSTAIVQVLKP
ncbi:MAG: DUF5018 domain-containing protein [Bacteroidetes bacterium]|nr:DUF5018 domain-containing protein [Bacteroidota bacterium]